VVPGPTEMFYMTLCADNNFRLVPGWYQTSLVMEYFTSDFMPLLVGLGSEFNDTLIASFWLGVEMLSAV